MEDVSYTETTSLDLGLSKWESIESRIDMNIIFLHTAYVPSMSLPSCLKSRTSPLKGLHIRFIYSSCVASETAAPVAWWMCEKGLAGSAESETKANLSRAFPAPRSLPRTVAVAQSAQGAARGEEVTSSIRDGTSMVMTCRPEV